MGAQVIEAQLLTLGQHYICRLNNFEHSARKTSYYVLGHSSTRVDEGRKC